jgi:hypothetical protein
MKKIKIKKFKSLYIFGLGVIGIGAFLVIMFIGFVTTVIINKIKEPKEIETVTEKPVIEHKIVYDTIKIKSFDTIKKEKPKTKSSVVKSKVDTIEKDSL